MCTRASTLWCAWAGQHHEQQQHKLYPSPSWGGFSLSVVFLPAGLLQVRLCGGDGLPIRLHWGRGAATQQRQTDPAKAPGQFNTSAGPCPSWPSTAEIVILIVTLVNSINVLLLYCYFIVLFVLNYRYSIGFFIGCNLYTLNARLAGTTLAGRDPG